MKHTLLRLGRLFILLLATHFFAPAAGFAQIVAAPTDKQLQALDKLMAPYRKKVTDILEADKTGQYKTYQADLAALAKAGTPERQRELADKLQRDHYDFIKKAYTRAVINHEEMRREIARILGHDKFQLDEFGGISSESFLPPGPLPLRFTAEMTCPFAVFQNQSNQNLVANCDAFANDCQVSATAIGEFDGGCRSKGWTGDKFELPAGTFQKITVTAQFDAYAWGFAFAVGGYSKAESKIGLRLQGPGFDQLVIVKDIWCVAPLIWFNHYETDATNFQGQVVFAGNFSGGNSFTAQVYSEAHAITVPYLNGCTSDCSAKSFDFIRVVATN